MSDDLSKRGPADRTKVNIHEPWEAQYWCKHWSCTPEELQLAVKKAGKTLVTAVKMELDKIIAARPKK